MRTVLCLSLVICISVPAEYQTKHGGVNGTSKTAIEGQVATLTLTAGVTTTIRLPEPVNTVVVGDPNLFQAEYSPNEPLLVFARPVISTAANSNLVISTTHGRQFIFLLRSLHSSANDPRPAVDLLVTCLTAGGHFIEEAFPSALISETVSLVNGEQRDSVADPIGQRQLDDMLRRQGDRKLEDMHGEGIRARIGQVLEQGSRLTVSFTVVNSKPDPIELVPPQVQLAGEMKTGIFKRTRWTTVQQLHVHTYNVTQRRLAPGARMDGVVVFERPAIKQSTERLLLQIADSAAIDRPTLVPIDFRSSEFLEKEHE